MPHILRTVDLFASVLYLFLVHPQLFSHHIAYHVSFFFSLNLFCSTLFSQYYRVYSILNAAFLSIPGPSSSTPFSLIFAVLSALLFFLLLTHWFPFCTIFFFSFLSHLFFFFVALSTTQAPHKTSISLSSPHIIAVWTHFPSISNCLERNRSHLRLCKQLSTKPFRLCNLSIAHKISTSLKKLLFS